MATLNRRKGPNVSQYIANLNTVGDNALNDDLFGQNDLSSFATTDFFDFDMGDNNLGSIPAPAEFDANHTDRKQSSASWEDPLSSDFLTGRYYLLFYPYLFSYLFPSNFLSPASASPSPVN
jgi:hypothetical protein